MENRKIYRHGDLLIREIETLPRGLKKVNSNILALGEVTGHSHQLMGEVQVMQNKEGKKFFRANEELELIHQEHKNLKIEKGVFEVLTEREYNPFEQEIRQVMD